MEKMSKLSMSIWDWQEQRSNDAGLCSNCRKDNLKRNPSRVSHQKEAITSNKGHQHTHSATVNEISVLKHSTHLFPLS